MGLTVILHNSDRRPAYICSACKEAVFAKGEEAAFERHQLKCFNRFEAELREQSMRTKAPHLFDPNVAGDPELQRWVDRHKQEIIEERKKI